MSTQPQPTAIELLSSLLAAINHQSELIETLITKLDSLAMDRQAAAAGSQAAAETDEYFDFLGETIIYTVDEKGVASYKIKGGPFREFGLRIWPEVLPLISCDPNNLKFGPNPLNRWVRAIKKDSKCIKVIGPGVNPG